MIESFYLILGLYLLGCATELKYTIMGVLMSLVAVGHIVGVLPFN